MNRAFTAIALILFASCLRAAPAEPREPGNEKWATVRGQVVFGGDNVPEPVATNAKLRGGPSHVEAWIVNPKNKGVKNVFVWLAIDTKDRGIRMPAEKIHPDLRHVPKAVPALDVVGKQFVPNSIALRAGQKLLLKNTSVDAVNFCYQGLHNNGNILVPANTTYTVADLKLESAPLLISCNIFPWMKAYGRVFDHPYFAITDDDGHFEIRLAPVGRMRLWIWHPESGYRDGARGKDGDPFEVKPRGTDVGAIQIRPIH